MDEDDCKAMIHGMVVGICIHAESPRTIRGTVGMWLHRIAVRFFGVEMSGHPVRVPMESLPEGLADRIHAEALIELSRHPISDSE